MKVVIHSIRHNPGGQWLIEVEAEGRREWMVIALHDGGSGHDGLKVPPSVRYAEAEVVARVREVQAGQRLTFPLEVVGAVVEEQPAGAVEIHPTVWLESYRVTGPRRYRMQVHAIGPGGEYESRGEYEWQFVDEGRFGPHIHARRWPEDGLFHRYQSAIEEFLMKVDRGAPPPLPYRLWLRFGGDR